MSVEEYVDPIEGVALCFLAAPIRSGGLSDFGAAAEAICDFPFPCCSELSHLMGCVRSRAARERPWSAERLSVICGL